MSEMSQREQSLSRILAGVQVAATCLLAGCFFVEPINEAPVPGIRVLNQGPYFVGDVVEFDATKSVDESKSSLSATWQAFAMVEGSLVSKGAPITIGLSSKFAVTIDSHEQIQVQLRVEDEYRATRDSPDTFAIDVGNQTPTLQLQLHGYREATSGEFVLARGIEIVAISDDPDEGDDVELSWELLPAAGSQTSERSFESVAADTYELIPDVAGQWIVRVTGDDSHGDTVTIEEKIDVARDGPPCLGILEPTPVEDAYYLVDSADGSRRFSVRTVLDALDPYPPMLDADPVLGEAAFRWFLQSPGSSDFVELNGYSAADYLVDPALYNPGDRLALRVEVADRVVGAERLLPCSGDAWQCALDTGTGCFQRMTWGINIR